MSEFTLQPASRQGIKPLVGLYGKSGGGKTRSALILARGIVGEKGRIGLIDTENRRGHIFADVIPGGYQVVDMDPPFTPERYVEAMEVIEKNCDILIIDSMTHEWSGDDGVLEAQEAELSRMAGTDYKKREQCKMAAWIKPKFRHKKMISHILRSSLPVICCLRGAEKTHMTKNNEGKTVVVTDDKCSPIFDKDFIFEMLINGESYSKEGKGGYLRIEKITHEDLFAALPKPGEQISITHGQAIAKWCASPGGKAPTAPTPPPATAEPAQSIGQHKNKLWVLTTKIHGGDPKKLETWLQEGLIIPDSIGLSDITVNMFPDVISKASVRIKEMG